MDFNRATSISLALRKTAVILCHHMITSNSHIPCHARYKSYLV